MANVHLVTGHAGTPHVKATDHAAMNAAIFGTGNYALCGNGGDTVSATLVDSTCVRISTGDLMMNGRHVRIEEAVNLAIEAGASSYNRNDLIVCRYSADNAGVEECNLVVLKGEETTATATDPSYTDESILNGATQADFPLFRVSHIGTTVTVSAFLGARWSNGGNSSDVTLYGAAGDGETDDTEAFQTALAENRCVYVPGGTYVLSEGITIGDNCELELAQGAVLEFTCTAGNCISMKPSASIRGHHATVRVPYEFTGNVLYVSTAIVDTLYDIEPFEKWDPMWKHGRYVTDLNIVKPDYRGYHYSLDGTCNGTAVYINANKGDLTSYIWGLNFSGLRIAGAFSYGILAEDYNGGWTHDMRIEAYIAACETGVKLVNANCARIAATIQPVRAYSDDESLADDDRYSVYAKCGVRMENCENTDLTGTRVWDWSSTITKFYPGTEYSSYCLIGDCHGTIIDDFVYYASSNWDVRELVYTDTESNLEQITFLNEPFTRWFKVKDGMPHVYTHGTEKQLCTIEDMGEIVDGERSVDYTNALDSAGITRYVRLNYSGESVVGEYYGHTGYIPCANGDTVYVKGMHFPDSKDNYCLVCFYDSSKTFLRFQHHEHFLAGSSICGLEETDDGFILTPTLSGVSYIRICVLNRLIDEGPIVSVNKEIKGTYSGYLAAGIKVKKDQVEGLSDMIDAGVWPTFHERLCEAVAKDGTTILNGIGYIKTGSRWAWSAASITTSDAEGCGCTGLITDGELLKGKVIRAKDIKFTYDGSCGVILFDADLNYLGCVTATSNLPNNVVTTLVDDYSETDDGFELTVTNASAKYIAFSFYTKDLGDEPAVAIDEEINYEFQGNIGEGITIKAEYVKGLVQFIEDVLDGVIQSDD